MRQLILSALKQGNSVSGEELGKKLNISRAAIWKHINKLRKKGYKITSSPQSGYRLIESAARFIPEEVDLGLNNKLIGKRILYREDVTSTQDVAEGLAKLGGEDGIVVISEKQSTGRGRKGRDWDSPTGEGIYLSVILRPNLTPGQVLQIPLIAGVAVGKAIKMVSSLEPRIKWPNDIMIGDRKVGGILTEMNSEINKVNYVILGIGINVTTPRALFPESIRSIATSLAEECGETISRGRLLRHILAEFESLYTQFLTSGFEGIREEWKAMNNTTGSRVKISGEEGEIEGEALDIDSEGFLLIRKENGNVKRIISGDVSLRAP